nr:type III-B CRISPR module-associated protein Cmr3 [Oscillochloris sp. ZM17-4]
MGTDIAEERSHGVSEPDETLWLIEPRDPLIVRDGRPFGPNPGARATTLPFPFPSTVAGALRHKAGLGDDGIFDRSQSGEVLKRTVRGPLLVQLHDDDHPEAAGAIADWLIPAPADALLLTPDGADESMILRRWLAPRLLAGGASTAMSDGLQPVSPASYERNKLSSKAPRFWYWDVFSRWLAAPQDDTCGPAALGIAGLEIDTRVHVSIQAETQTALDGALFQTSGLELTWRDHEHQQEGGFTTRRLALAAVMNGQTPRFLGGLAPLGGERRLMRWSAHAPDLPDWPEGLRERIIRERRCRVILLTPACFKDGYRPPPKWTRGKATATLVGAAVSRAQAISGWDMAHINKNGSYGQPKPTRHLAPAGSVYYVTFPHDADVEDWLKKTWMQNVSDDVQDQLDGFGLAAVGVWPDTSAAQEVPHA